MERLLLKQALEKMLCKRIVVNLTAVCFYIMTHK